MSFDFSLINKIDFKNWENLLFFGIALFLVAVFLWIIFIIIEEVARMIRRIIIKVFNIDVPKPKFNQKDTEWLHKKTKVNSYGQGLIPHQKDKNDIKIQTMQEDAEVPEKQNIPADNPPIKDKKNVVYEEEKDEDKIKEQKSISEQLEKLKTADDDLNVAEETLASKMPSREEKNPNEIKYEKIEIPTSVQNKASSLHQTLISQKKAGYQNIDSDVDYSMFEGKSEISREALKEKMESDPKIWQAASQHGLNLGPLERAKLVKEIFSPELGINISKSDLKQSIQKLNQKLFNTKSSTEHAKIRKEINFFKKIGGIK